MGAMISNNLLEQIQRVYPHDTVDDILDWSEAARDYDTPLTVSEYGEWRVDNSKHGDAGELGCM